MGTINEKGEILPQATGFLVNINDIFHLVTAKHVVFDRQKDVLNDSNILTFYNTKDGKIQARSIQDMRDNINCNWIFHENREVDIEEEMYKDIQRINLEWLDRFWRPFLVKEEEKKDKTHKEEET